MRKTGWDKGVCLLLVVVFCLAPCSTKKAQRKEEERHNVRLLSSKEVRAFASAKREGSSPEQIALGMLGAIGGTHAATTLQEGGDQGSGSEMKINTIVHESEFGPIVVVMEGEIDGLPIWGQRVSVALNRDTLEPAAYSGYLPTDKTASKRNEAKLSPQETATRGVANVKKVEHDLLQVTEKANAEREDTGPYSEFTYSQKNKLKDEEGEAGEVRYRPVWYDKGAESLEPAVYMEVGTDFLIVSSVDGATLLQGSLINDAFKFRVWADPATGRPLTGPLGDQFFPSRTGLNDDTPLSYVEPSLLSVMGSDPWLPDGATELTGNNVDAYADLDAPDGYSEGDVRPVSSGPNEFDYTYDLAKEPWETVSQISAAVTEMFYVINWLHDWFYEAGFNEVSGNAQQDNYDRGGLEGDPIHAEGQDYFRLNNANMFTPADGRSPRMQMFLWSPKYDANVTIFAPSSETLEVAIASFGPTDFDVSGDLILVNDGTDTTTDGCQAIQNSVAGKVALIDRGNCYSGEKVQNAAKAGAIGVIIINNEGTTEPYLMGDCPVCNPADPYVPVLGVSKNDGTQLKDMLGGGIVTVNLFRQTYPYNDGTIDNQIVAHEWAHYLSARLVPSLTFTQSKSMGEGWSDFVALLMGIAEDDIDIAANEDWAGVFPLVTYAVQGTVKDPAYFGIRRYPYSTDMTKNPLTFKHITEGMPLPADIPISFEPENNEVHAAGEVWCVALWEVYAALLRDSGRLTFAEAQRRMKNYLVASLKMTPPDPTFLEARDALLGVVAATDHQDWNLVCAAFAKRGMGLSARGPDRDSETLSGVVESYDCSAISYDATMRFEPEALACDKDGIFDNTEKAKIYLSLKNTVAQNASLEIFVEKLSELPYLEFPLGNPMTVLLPGFEEMELVIPMEFSPLQGVEPGVLNLLVQVMNEELSFAFPITDLVNIDIQWQAATVDPMAVPKSAWTAVHGDYSIQGDISYLSVPGEASPPRWYWHMQDDSGPYESFLVSPTFTVAGDQDFVITFDHVFGLEENFDGGFVELLVDGEWIDITPFSTTGLAGDLWPLATGSSNPMEDKEAYNGLNPSYPNPDTEVIDLQKRFAGKRVAMRFHLAVDEYAGWTGWEILRVELQGVVTSPFPIQDSQNPNTLCETAVCFSSWPHRQATRRRQMR